MESLVWWPSVLRSLIRSSQCVVLNHSPICTHLLFKLEQQHDVTELRPGSVWPCVRPEALWGVVIKLCLSRYGWFRSAQITWWYSSSHTHLDPYWLNCVWWWTSWASDHLVQKHNFRITMQRCPGNSSYIILYILYLNVRTGTLCVFLYQEYVTIYLLPSWPFDFSFWHKNMLFHEGWKQGHLFQDWCSFDHFSCGKGVILIFLYISIVLMYNRHYIKISHHYQETVT